MFFINLFRKIRQKPKHERDRYALLFASTFTGIIALVWSVHVFSKDYAPKNPGDREKAFMFSGLIKQSKEQLAGVKNAVSQELPSEEVRNDSGEDTVRKEFEINLTAEDVELARQRMNSTSSNDTYNSMDGFGSDTPTSTNTTNSQNYQYQEIQIVTVPSATSSASANSEVDTENGSDD